MMRQLILAAWAVLLPALAFAQTNDGALVSEMSSHHVAISARYTGGSILLFGAMSTPGQIIVKVRSPDEDVALQKKGRVGPFWLTQGKHVIHGTPGLYYLLSSAPIDRLLPAAARAAHGLDLQDALKDMKIEPEPANAAERQALAAALLKLEQARHHYVADPGAVEIIGGRLYMATIDMPAQLPLGEYAVSIYLVKDGKVIATQHTSIDVNEVGLEQWLFNAANQHSWLFGIVFTAAMMLLGLLLGVVLGRNKKKG